MKTILFSGLIFLFIHMPSGAQDNWQRFNQYWYAGEAELASYELDQFRYGQMHKGHAVLVFVTEPFSKRRQVKLDNPEDAGDNNVLVMKLNFTKKFLTGIYPYSMMMSSFVPVSYDKYPDALKVTMSSQEWCGQTFTQLNLDGNEYALRGFSYFETEGDFETEVPNAWLEDELWQRIRIEPESLPTGAITIFPGTFYQRLRHRDFQSKSAVASLETVTTSSFSDDPHRTYHIKYADRELKIHFNSSFPHEILGWEETYGGRTTVGKLKSIIKTPYWQQNQNKDREVRTQLGLSTGQ